MAHEAAVLVLRETGNPAVMWGDEGLLHAIAERAQLRCAKQSFVTSNRVLNTLTRRPGILVKGMMTIRALRGGERAVRCFWLPEHAPEGLR
jgi:hypothetical protein